MSINVAIMILTYECRFSLMRHRERNAFGVEYKSTFMLGQDETLAELFSINGRLSSVSFTSGSYCKKYDVKSRKELLAAYNDYFGVWPYSVSLG